MGVESRVVGQDHIGHAAQSRQLRVRDHIAHAIIIVQAVLIFQHVQARRANLAAFQPGDQCIAVDQLAAGGVDDGHARLHALNCFGVDEMVILLRSVGVQSDDIAFRQQGLQRHILGDLLYLVVGVQVVGQQAAAKAGQMLQHRAANAACTDHTHSAGGNIAADFSLQGVVLRFAALEDVPCLAQAHQHEHNGKVCNAVWRVVHIGHLHAQFPGRLAVYVVIADGTAADGLYAQLVKPLDHGRAHITGRYRHGIIALCQFSVFQRGILLRRAKLNVQLRCQPLRDAQLIVGAQGVKKDFCCHKTSLPAYFVPIVARSAQMDAFYCMNFVHLKNEDSSFHMNARKTVVNCRKRGYDKGTEKYTSLKYKRSVPYARL